MTLSGIKNFLIIAIIALTSLSAHAGELNKPWRAKHTAIALDAYEFNSLNWNHIVKDKRIAAFIGKASDGLSPKYCSSSDKSMCGVTWRKYSVARELYHTRRQLAKALGLKWGAYPLARPGNPEKQAMHFIQYAEPKADEAIVLDLEGINSSEYMSLSDAERFARHIYKRLGRYPILYTNHSTARHIATNAGQYPLLSRLKLWYARYIDDITNVFPMGNWQKPTLWQFVHGGNCRKRSCPYRVNGTPKDIDVNVSTLTVQQLRKAWPFDGLEPQRVRPEAELLLANSEDESFDVEKSDNIVIQHNIGLVSPVPVANHLALISYKRMLVEDQHREERKLHCEEYGFIENGDACLL